MNGIQIAKTVGAIGGFVAITAGTFKVFDILSRKSNEDLARNLIGAFDHNQNGTIDYRGANPPTILDDERFAGTSYGTKPGYAPMPNGYMVGGPANSISEPAGYGAHAFVKLDTDKNGQVTLAEARAGYEALDTNKNGHIGGWFSRETPLQLTWAAPKVLDYKAPTEHFGVTKY
jgi:hypothetical protein